MPDRISKWVCSICRLEYSEHKDVIRCEAVCSNKQEDEKYIAQKLMIFPETHKNDDRYKKHCVECGQILFERDRYWDGHRNEPGDVIYEDENQAMLLNGRYCSKCLQAKIKKIIYVYQKVYD